MVYPVEGGHKGLVMDVGLLPSTVTTLTIVQRGGTQGDGFSRGKQIWSPWTQRESADLLVLWQRVSQGIDHSSRPDMVSCDHMSTNPPFRYEGDRRKAQKVVQIEGL